MSFHIRKNLALAIAETVVTVASQFLLYRLIVHHLALPSLGVWALVMASFSIGRLGDLGVSAGLNRFVAVSHPDRAGAGRGTFIETALLTSTAIYLLIGVVAAPAIWFGVGRLLSDPSEVDLARRIVPFGVVSFAAVNIAAVTMSAVSGTQNAYLKSSIIIASNLVLLGSAKLLIDSFGLRGVAVAQILQAVTVAGVGWLVLRRIVPGLPAVPRRWSRQAFRSLVGYGAQVQVGALGAFLFDPVTKMILAHFGGTASVGLYEVASRVVMQCRSPVNSLNLTLVPAFAALRQSARAQALRLYRRSIALTAVSAALMPIGLSVMAPLVQAVALPKAEGSAFRFVLLVLAAGWSFNMLAIPAYVMGLGSGQVRNNTISHLIILAAAPLLAWTLGQAFGGRGVVAGAMLGHALGSLFLLLGYAGPFSPGGRNIAAADPPASGGRVFS